ncbi:TonB-dependent receptor [Bacteroidales bacterium]|nr:TonB-dependent receptor [Bacteroidales bacterium]
MKFQIGIDKKKITFVLVAFLFLQGSAQDTPPSVNIFEMSMEELMNQEVSIATKSAVNVKQAPSVVSVITKEEIELSTARNLQELLKQIPGFEFSARYNSFEGVGFRGVMDNRTSARHLILIDGKPFNQIFYGQGFDMQYTGIDMHIVERIEIIRGPGSALFGKNAFLSVINIITKEAQKGEMLKARIEAGSFNAARTFVSVGNKWDANKHFNISFSHIRSDITDTKAADSYDRLQDWNDKNKTTGIYLNATLGDLQFYVNGILSEYGTHPYESSSNKNSIHYSLKYTKKLSEKLKLSANIYGQTLKNIENFEYIKKNDDAVAVPGTDSTPDIRLMDIYPDGVYYTPYFTEYQVGWDIMAEQQLSENNQLLAGVQVTRYGVYDVEILSNLNLRTGEYYPGYNRTNLPKDSIGWFDNGEHHYANIALYAQDIWYPFENLGFTLGARLDVDSEIGPIFSPRAGVNYIFNKRYNAKFLYGQAYRAPSPSEQFQTLGFAFGNKDLKPEYIKTLEIEFAQNFERINNRLNVFYNMIENMIYAETKISVDASNRYYNLGTNNSFGFEVESRQRLGDKIYSHINYSYNKSVNRKIIDEVIDKFNHYDISPHKINFGLILNLPYNLVLSTDGFYRSKRFKYKAINPTTGNKEEVSEDPVGDYLILNAKLMYRKQDFPLEVFVSGYNLLNTEYYSQDNERKTYPAMSGIHFSGGVVFSF